MSVRYPDPLLTDGNLTLRPWSFDDLDSIREAGTDPEIPNKSMPRSVRKERRRAA